MAMTSSQRLMKCPKCLTPNNTTGAKLGAKIKCSKCNSLISVKEPGSSAGAVAASPSGRAEPPAEQPRPARASGVTKAGGRGSTKIRKGARPAEESQPERPRGKPKKEQKVPVEVMVVGIMFCVAVLVLLIFLLTSNKKPVLTDKGSAPTKTEAKLAGDGDVPIPANEIKPKKPEDWLPEIPGDKKTPVADGGDAKKGGGGTSGSGSTGGSTGGGGGGEEQPDSGPKSDHMTVDSAVQSEIAGMLASWQEKPRDEIIKATAELKARGFGIVPALINCIASADEWVGRYATDVLKEMLDHQYSFSFGLTMEDREVLRQKWVRWWNSNAEDYLSGRAMKAPDEDKQNQFLDEICLKLAKADFDEKMTLLDQIRRKGVEILPALIGKLTNETKDVARGAARALEDLTGELMGEFPADFPQPFHDKWQEWYTKNKDTFTKFR